MNAKIIVYYFENGVAAFRTFSSTNDTIEIVGNKDNWPLLVDLAFEPDLASSICEQLSRTPNFAYASKSFANANLPHSCRVLHSRNVKILERDGFVILNYFGTKLTTDEKVFDAIADTVDISVQDSENHELNEVLELPLSGFEFSVRTTNVFVAQNYEKISDLMSLSEIDFLKLPNFGRRSLNEVIDFLDGFGLKLSTDTDAYIDYHRKNNGHREHQIPETMVKNFREAIASFNERERNIILLRAENYTLEEIGQRYKLTRERIRQIEAKALRKLKHPSRRWAAHYWSDRLVKIFDYSILPVNVDYIASVDGCFAHEEAEKNLLGYLISTCCWGKFHCVEFNGSVFISRISQKMLDEARLSVKNLVAKCLGKTRLEIESLAKEVVDLEGREFISSLVSDSLKYSIFRDNDGEEVLSTYSERRTGFAVAEHIMRNAEYPLKNEEIEQIIKTQFPEMEARNVMNRFQELKDVFPLRHGVWATIKHLGFSDYELSRLKVEIHRAVDSIDKTQFHSQDILIVLQNNGSEFSSRLDGFKLAGLIRKFCLETYLGRSVFTKDQNFKSRLLLHDVIVSVLREAGQPLKNSKIRDQVIEVRGYEGYFQVFPKPPIVALGNGYFALDHWVIRKEGNSFFRDIEAVEEKPFATPDNRTYVAPKDGSSHQFEPPVWSDQKIQKLRGMWLDGHSISEIAKTLEISRNSVAGKAHRLKLPKRQPKTDQGDQNNLENIAKIQRLLKAQFSLSQISEILKLDISEVQKIIANHND